MVGGQNITEKLMFDIRNISSSGSKMLRPTGILYSLSLGTKNFRCSGKFSDGSPVRVHCGKESGAVIGGEYGFNGRLKFLFISPKILPTDVLVRGEKYDFTTEKWEFFDTTNVKTMSLIGSFSFKKRLRVYQRLLDLPLETDPEWGAYLFRASALGDTSDLVLVFVFNEKAIKIFTDEGKDVCDVATSTICGR